MQFLIFINKQGLIEIMPKEPGDSQYNKEIRQAKLQEIILQADTEDKTLSKPEMQKALLEFGYQISLVTLYDDLREIAVNDSFIQDLASKTYSSIMHLAFSRYNTIYKNAMKVYDSENHLTRKIKSETDKGVFNQTITEINDSVKLQALSVAKNASDSIIKMVNGENLHKSASQWIQATKAQQATINDLRKQLSSYDKAKIDPNGIVSEITDPGV